jgi:rhamnose utilization protein RhaD (predicted bifunctional aldolase and dehydrogenase)/NAD(P)-dependent dehydrogenase (short-subunit alcohol dehydrogenase family)
MENLWSERDAQAAVERYTKQGASFDLAMRTYSTRLLGAEKRLVIHGGGNTSVKSTAQDLTGETVEVLCVKGSGWDMATIEPAGLPAVRLAPLRQLEALERLSDEAMMHLLRVNLLDPAAPNPSVETLLHAFLPHKFIDHTHANAVLALTDQPHGEKLCAQVYGRRVALVPYIMPGFLLAKRAAALFRDDPDVEGMILLKHGVFSFGETAKQAYDRMIDIVTLAEERIASASRMTVAGVHLPKGLGRTRPRAFTPIHLPAIAPLATVAPILRGLAALSEADGYRRFVLAHRRSPLIEDFVNGVDLPRYGCAGTATPDHVIRTKRLPLITPPPDAAAITDFAAAARAAFTAYADNHQRYFARHNARHGGTKRPLDVRPRVILVPGLGLFGCGASRREAEIAADLAEANIEVITAAESLETFESVSEADAFDMEYWSLEQAKLGKAVEKPLARAVVLITGAGSGIGAATARAFRAAGADVALLDIAAETVEQVAAQTAGLAVPCDVTDGYAIAAAFDRVIEAYGGVDIVVSNAGAAWQGRIGEVEEAVLRRSFDLNFWAHQRIARRAVAVMRAQGTGGCLLFNASKQALNPGRDFGPYGLPKAATLALMRQYAVDYGRDGIRANAVNADRVRSGLLTEQMVRERARARGVSETEYMSGNLLRCEVTADDVARAFVHLALSAKTTAAILTVDGGNIEAAVR